MWCQPAGAAAAEMSSCKTALLTVCTIMADKQSLKVIPGNGPYTDKCQNCHLRTMCSHCRSRQSDTSHQTAACDIDCCNITTHIASAMSGIVSSSGGCVTLKLKLLTCQYICLFYIYHPALTWPSLRHGLEFKSLSRLEHAS